MQTITTNDGGIVMNGGTSAIPKGNFTAVATKDGNVSVKSICGTVTWILNPEETTVDGESFDTNKELVEKLVSFSKGGGDGQGVAWDDIIDKPTDLVTTEMLDETVYSILSNVFNNVVSDEQDLDIEARGTYTFNGSDAEWILPKISDTVGATVRIINWGSGNFTVSGHADDIDAINDSGVNQSTKTFTSGETSTFYNNSLKWVIT